MTYPVVLSQGWNKLADEIDEEIKRARAKFPNPLLLTTALTEEHGEAIRAVLEHHYAVNKRDAAYIAGNVDAALAMSDAIDKTRAEVRKELIQTAAMCIRLALEGDPAHRLSPQSD